MPHPVDVHVGARLRLARLEAKKSQADVARAVGITFQQVQKYENGSNRISASRLFEFSEILDVDIMYFFQDIYVANGGGVDLNAGYDRDVDLILMDRISRLDDTGFKRAMIRLIEAAVSSQKAMPDAVADGQLRVGHE